METNQCILYGKHIMQFVFQGRKLVMAVSVDGPIRGLFMCTLPPGTAIHVTDIKDSILTQPFGKEMKQVMTSERGGHVFFQAFQPNG